LRSLDTRIGITRDARIDLEIPRAACTANEASAFASERLFECTAEAAHLFVRLGM